jgi:hypothetical protein
MVGLIDLAVASEEVSGVKVFGMTARGVAHVLSKFPELRKVMSGVKVDPEDLMRSAPDAVSAIIAAGVGRPGDADTENLADNLPFDVQAEFLAAIFRLTMPNGAGPFVEKLKAMMGGLESPAPLPKARATK